MSLRFCLKMNKFKILKRTKVVFRSNHVVDNDNKNKESLFESIKTEPFKIPEDDGNDLMHTFFNPDKEGWLWKQVMKKDMFEYHQNYKDTTRRKIFSKIYYGATSPRVYFLAFGIFTMILTKKNNSRL